MKPLFTHDEKKLFPSSSFSFLIRLWTKSMMMISCGLPGIFLCLNRTQHQHWKTAQGYWCSNRPLDWPLVDQETRESCRKSKFSPADFLLQIKQRHKLYILHSITGSSFSISNPRMLFIQIPWSKCHGYGCHYLTGTFEMLSVRPEITNWLCFVLSS